MPVDKKWSCDVCGQPVLRIKDGWVEWINYRDGSGQERAKDFRIVHNKSVSPLEEGCQFGEKAAEQGKVSSLPLQYFLGTDGLMFMFSLISEGKIPREQLLEMAKRLHIRGYEEARGHFEKALDAGVIHQHWSPGFYSQEQISKVLTHKGRDDTPKARAPKPVLNITHDFSDDDLCRLLASCDDVEGRHILWVSRDGEIDIALLPPEVAPAKWAQSVGTKLKFRYETFQSGRGHVGFEAARNKEWVKELHEALRRDWRTNKTGCIDY